ncbi:MAG: hypothetical protein J6W41_00285 [Alphaproteobacteria bacterium]|nr:hypothetical protein [Alphaproteobacteria bacterium]
MPIKLKHEDSIAQSSICVNKDTLKDNIVVHRDSGDEFMDTTTFQAFQKIVNRRRPYSSFDFVSQTFIPDLSALDKQRGC